MKYVFNPRLLFIITAIFAQTTAYAAEPAYCSVAEFNKLEIPLNISGIKRAHAYKLGGITLVGLAVGQSDVNGTIKLATTHSSVGAAEKYCTWYLNEGNTEAEQTFVHEYVSKPGGDAQKSAQEYITKLGKYFDSAPVNFLACANQRGYIAMGCEGQQHRGPSVFGMLLAYSGCTPEHAAAITNGIWGLNGVPAESRLAVINEGYKLGQAHATESDRLQQLFLGLAH